MPITRRLSERSYSATNSSKPSSAWDLKVGEASEFSYQEVVVGSIVGALLHELGHAVFDMNEVPVMGREEDAADLIATFIALQFSKDVARTVVRGTAYLHKVFFAFGAPLYWDNHGTGLQRYYNSLCIAYGGAPDLFKELVAKSDMPKSRLDNCAHEYRAGRACLQEDAATLHRSGEDEAGAIQDVAQSDTATGRTSAAAAEAGGEDLQPVGLQYEQAPQCIGRHPRPDARGSEAMAVARLVRPSRTAVAT